MTREEAIENLYTFINYFKDEIEHDGYGDKIFDTEQAQKDIETFKMSVQALSQEPTEKAMTVDEMEREYEKSKALFHKIVECDDAISREAVLNTEYQVKEINGIEYVMLSEVQMKIRKMPPVTQKSGKWILTIEDWNK